MSSGRLILLLTTILCLNPLFSQVYDYTSGFVKSPLPADQTSLTESFINDKGPVYDELSGKQRTMLQSYYKERNKFTAAILNSDELITGGPLYDYVNSIFNVILKSNPEIPADSKMFLVNNTTTNAFTAGNNIIFIYTGLIYTMRSSDEVAFVISHELAHNSFQHSDKGIYKNVMLMTDVELNDQISKISRQQYQKVSSLNQLFLPKLLEDKENSRKQEMQADSLGVKFMLAAGFDISGAIATFEKFSALEDYKNEPEVNFVSILGVGSQSIINKSEVYKESNSLGNFADTSELTNYLRTHPHGKQRLETIRSSFRINISASPIFDSVYYSYRYLANGEMIDHSLKEGNLTEAFFYSLQMKNAYPADNYSLLQLAFISAELSYLKKQRKAGKFLALQSRHQDRTYDRTVYFLQNLSPDECQEISESLMKTSVIPENDIAGFCIQTIWEFNKANYEEYSSRSDVMKGLAAETAYESYLLDMNAYFVKSGKSKTKSQ